jgi:serine/threonine protein kinase
LAPPNVLSCAARCGEPLAVSEHDYEPGDTIRGNGAEYRVLSVLGSGGMGAVYLVKDKNIGKRFVLKILHGHLAHRNDLKERFEHEARALGHLDHEGIIEIFQLNRTCDDKQMPYYLMEPLTGESLGATLYRLGKMELFPALGIATKLLYALDYAHGRGVVHRDIKPDNIFLHQLPSRETSVKLLDFGILKLVQSGDDPNVFVGTPRYSAPEQLRVGSSVGPKADLYSTGVVLFRMLTGHVPFEEYPQTLEGMVQTLIVPPPSLSDYGDFPEALVTLVASALAKDPDERPADAFAFATELQKIRRAFKPVREDPHTKVTAEVIGPAEIKEPSQITSAHLAAPTTPDAEMVKLMAALRAGDGGDGALVRITGFESTEDKRDAILGRGANAHRRAATVLPSSEPKASATPGSIEYLADEDEDSDFIHPRPRPRTRPAQNRTEPLPLPVGGLSLPNVTEPMAPALRSRAGSRSQSDPTPDPQTVEARASDSDRRRSARRGHWMGRRVPVRLLAFGVVLGGVVAVGLVGLLTITVQRGDVPAPAGKTSPPVVTVSPPPPLTDPAPPPGPEALPQEPGAMAASPFEAEAKPALSPAAAAPSLSTAAASTQAPPKPKSTSRPRPPTPLRPGEPVPPAPSSAPSPASKPRPKPADDFIRTF